MEKNCCDCEHTYNDDICECELFNKYEEAIRDIKLAIQPVCGGTSLEVAIEALEKQIPTHPGIIESTIYALEWYKCTVCNNEWGGSQGKYCSECGQKLRWD